MTYARITDTAYDKRGAGTLGCASVDTGAHASRLERLLGFLHLLPRLRGRGRGLVEGVRLLVEHLLDHYLDHVLVAEVVREPRALRRVLGGPAPDEAVVEVVHQALVQLQARRLDSGAVAARGEHHRVEEVRRRPALLCVDPDEREVLPDLVEEPVVVELHVSAEHGAVRLRADALHLLDGRVVDLVVHVETLDVVPVALDDVAELVHREVLPDEHVRVVDLVLVQHVEDVLLRDGRRLGREVDGHAARRLALEVDVGW
mmetsp:Transcript_26857/g.79139  ORF Transcript_26857/g.79139 Transcript_26857/m.79139 type:complete len:259 (+) Transcript_26857:344-1120(+)